MRRRSAAWRGADADDPGEDDSAPGTGPLDCAGMTDRIGMIDPACGPGRAARDTPVDPRGSCPAVAAVLAARGRR
jgi:hypothetical protein